MFKGVKKAYLEEPPATGQLPESFSGSAFDAELDQREPAVSYKAKLQPPPTGQLPEFFNGVRELPDEPEVFELEDFQPERPGQKPESFSGSAFNSEIATKEPPKHKAQFQPPPTTTLPKVFSGSSFKAELDKREPAVGFKAKFKPPLPGELPEFFSGVKELPDPPEAEPVDLTPTPPTSLPTFFGDGKKNTKVRRSATQAFVSMKNRKRRR